QIQEILQKLPPRDEDGPARLPIDRHFTVSGFGTIVTGTLLSGKIGVGDTVEVLPPGEAVRVREIQVHGRKADVAHAGQRVALNLAGLERANLQRGAIVGTGGFYSLAERIDARLTLLPEAPRPIKFRDPVHLHLGTARVTARVILLDRDELEPGESALVQFLLDTPLVAHRQDRFIVRSYSPMTTIGGGQIIDPAPKKHRRFRPEVMQALAELESGESSFLVQKLAELGCAKLKELEQASGLGRERVANHLDKLLESGQVRRFGEQWVTGETARSWQRLLGEVLDAFHRDNALLPGIPHATLKAALPAKVAAKTFEQLLDEQIDAGHLEQRKEWIARPGFEPAPTAEQQKLLEKLEDAYRETGFQAKGRVDMLAMAGTPPDQAERLFTYLFAVGKLVRLNDDSYLHCDSYASALAALENHFTGKQTLTLAEFRDLIGSARKQTQALLEHFDGLKYTMRKGDERIAWQLKREA
ncbi:MAG: SelB C-terminal domain-containing protein, partial [Desulfofustis sp.]|nr:SelB C-terminal domain-containing protein [Desulfofustis sp.]